MKTITTLLAAFSILAAVPCHAAAKKDDKKDAKSKKEDKNKKDDKEWDKENLYTVSVTTTTGEPTEADMSAVKTEFMTATAFKCKDIKLDGKEIVATLSTGKEKGRLSKSDVARMLKEKPTYKVAKLDEVKPEKEKKDKKDDKKEEKK